MELCTNIEDKIWFIYFYTGPIPFTLALSLRRRAVQQAVSSTDSFQITNPAESKSKANSVPHDEAKRALLL